jgi:protein-tyrosine phosphatase
LVEDGITTVIATPHELGAYEGCNSAPRVRDAVNSLNQALIAQAIPLRVVPGADVRVDDQLLGLLDSDQILTLGDGGRYILLELPQNTLINLMPIIRALSEREIVAVISHPERQANICRDLALLNPWLDGGALLQVTAGSLLGDFGPVAQKAAWEMLSLGVVSFVASDAHDHVQRPPAMTRAIQAITARIGHAVARKLCIENPGRILDDQTMGCLAGPGCVGGRA